MTERKDVITFQGNPLTLVGNPLTVGDKAPDFKLLDNGLGEKTMADYKGKTLVVVTVPSLDTAVCDLEARRFNNEAGNLGDDVRTLVVSMDLPFAQKRWSDAVGVEALETLSDHREASLGEGWGLLIKELRLLARTIYIVDAEGVVRYEQLVSEVTEEPDYEAVLNAVRKITS
ncbi:thiol peroxidase [Salidesulfovibrio brasiliensis]|uniref:thiol peroxidase n=1 Tax=Salidesulfovibrio brasiliensis TaxID=221711 RepID=UPI0006D0BE35|nr:thiol peroxidase [Salidesulfovibrio brasiliensis]